jgi:hypothetical protein
MAFAGSVGVEKTFRICSVESRSQTQSVNVPPLSMAIRRGVLWGALLISVFFFNRVFTLKVVILSDARATVRASRRIPKVFMLPRREKAFSQDMRFAATMLPYNDVPFRARRSWLLQVRRRSENLLRWPAGLPRHSSRAVPSPLGSPRLAVGIRDGMSLGEECSRGFIASNPAQSKILYLCQENSLNLQLTFIDPRDPSTTRH